MYSKNIGEPNLPGSMIGARNKLAERNKTRHVPLHNGTFHPVKEAGSNKETNKDSHVK